MNLGLSYQVQFKFVSLAGEACLLLVPNSARDATQDEFLGQIGSASLAGFD